MRAQTPFSSGYTFGASGMPNYNVSNTWQTNAQGLMGPLAGILGNLFGNSQKNPADAAMPYLNQIPGMMQGYYSPYINNGMQDMGMLQGQYNTLINDPGSLMKSIGAGFQASPGYQYQVDQATQAANNSAAAGGMVGSPAAQKFIANQVNGLASQDYNNYMNQALGLYGMGMNGLQQGNQMGYNASNSLAEALAQNSMNQANLAYQGQINQNQSQGGLWGDIGSLAGAVIPFL